MKLFLVPFCLSTILFKVISGGFIEAVEDLESVVELKNEIESRLVHYKFRRAEIETKLNLAACIDLGMSIEDSVKLGHNITFTVDDWVNNITNSFHALTQNCTHIWNPVTGVKCFIDNIDIIKDKVPSVKTIIKTFEKDVLDLVAKEEDGFSTCFGNVPPTATSSVAPTAAPSTASSADPMAVTTATPEQPTQSMIKAKLNFTACTDLGMSIEGSVELGHNITFTVDEWVNNITNRFNALTQNCSKSWDPVPDVKCFIDNIDTIKNEVSSVKTLITIFKKDISDLFAKEKYELLTCFDGKVPPTAAPSSAPTTVPNVAPEQPTQSKP